MNSRSYPYRLRLDPKGTVSFYFRVNRVLGVIFIKKRLHEIVPYQSGTSDTISVTNKKNEPQTVGVIS